MNISDILASIPTTEQPLLKGGTWSAPDVAKMTGLNRVDEAFQRYLGKAYKPLKTAGSIASDILAYVPKTALRSAYNVGQIAAEQPPEDATALERMGFQAKKGVRQLGAQLPLGVALLTLGLGPAAKAPTALGRIGQGITRGAKMGSLFGGTGELSEGLIKGESIEDVAKRALTGVAQGGVAGGALGGVISGGGELVKALRGLTRSMPKPAQSGFIDPFSDISKKIEHGTAIPQNVGGYGPSAQAKYKYAPGFKEVKYDPASVPDKAYKKFEDIPGGPELMGKKVANLLEVDTRGSKGQSMRQMLHEAIPSKPDRDAYRKEISTVMNVIQTYSDMANEKFKDQAQKEAAIDKAIRDFRTMFTQNHRTAKYISDKWVTFQGSKKVPLMKALDEIISKKGVDKSIAFDNFIQSEHYRGNVLTIDLDMHGSNKIQTRVSNAIKMWLDALRDYQPPAPGQLAPEFKLKGGTQMPFNTQSGFFTPFMTGGPELGKYKPNQLPFYGWRSIDKNYDTPAYAKQKVAAGVDELMNMAKFKEPMRKKLEKLGYNQLNHIGETLQTYSNIANQKYKTPVEKDIAIDNAVKNLLKDQKQILSFSIADNLNNIKIGKKNVSFVDALKTILKKKGPEKVIAFDNLMSSTHKAMQYGRPHVNPGITKNLDMTMDEYSRDVQNATKFWLDQLAKPSRKAGSAEMSPDVLRAVLDTLGLAALPVAGATAYKAGKKAGQGINETVRRALTGL